jgi:dihydrofolate reductase
MRRIVGSLFVSVDGVVESPEAWQPPFFDEELGAIVGQSLAVSEGFVLGRRTYDEWAAFWPTAETPIAPLMNQMASQRRSTARRSFSLKRWSRLLPGAWIGGTYYSYLVVVCTADAKPADLL